MFSSSLSSSSDSSSVEVSSHSSIDGDDESGEAEEQESRLTRSSAGIDEGEQGASPAEEVLNLLKESC